LRCSPVVGYIPSQLSILVVIYQSIDRGHWITITRLSRSLILADGCELCETTMDRKDFLDAERKRFSELLHVLNPFELLEFRKFVKKAFDHCDHRMCCFITLTAIVSFLFWRDSCIYSCAYVFDTDAHFSLL
jgi:hypothetical protein